jgi:hypothetical protein
MNQDEYTDAFGFVGPLKVTSGQRKIPDAGFPTGPGIGERLPDIELGDQTGRRVALHADRGGSKAAVVLFRSAVW